MARGKFVFTWDKSPLRIIAGIGALWFTTYVDLWSKVNWYGALLLIVGITFLFFTPGITTESNRIEIRREDREEDDG